MKVDAITLPLPPVRCLTKEQAAAYLGIGVTLLLRIGPPPLKLGRRSVWDVVDLDRWLENYKNQGRAGKESEWLVQRRATGGAIPATGGSLLDYQTADAYAEALKPRNRRRKPKRPSRG